MKSICFFNHYHNGDIFHSKSFVKQIVESLDTKFLYAHSNDPRLLLDLNVFHSEVPQIDSKVKFLETEDTVYVNTWIGSYFDEGAKYLGECTLRFSYEMFSKIYEKLNSIFDSDLKLSPIEEYFPVIDYSKFYISDIDKYIEEDLNSKILISNGPCLSGQCKYHEDMSPVINYLANKYPNITFITTKKIFSNFKNIKYTSDIIKFDGCDLNEIGYLSTFCDIIVGRNSGPFCFCTNKDNINNENTAFYCFADDVTTCFLYEIDINSKFVFEHFNSLDNIIESIESLILKI